MSSGEVYICAVILRKQREVRLMAGRRRSGGQWAVKKETALNDICNQTRYEAKTLIHWSTYMCCTGLSLCPGEKNELLNIVLYLNICIICTLIRSFSFIMSPVISLLKKGLSKLKWNPLSHQALKKLKEAFTTAPIFNHPDLSKLFIVEVDSSEMRVRAVFSQRLG